MIVTEQRNIGDILKSLEGLSRIFLVGCGECATVCKTGGERELLKMKEVLEARGKTVSGTCIPNSPCAVSQVRTEFAKNISALRQTDAILVLACGLGAQAVKESGRFNLAVLPACNTLFGAVIDAQGNFFERCSLCGDCVLDITAGVCPVTSCAKGILNGPCGGMDKGKCETDKEKDCAWVLIYNELDKRKKIGQMRKIQPPKNFKKTTKPRRLAAV